MDKKDTIWTVVAIIAAIALIAIAIVTDTPLLSECNVNTPC